MRPKEECVLVFCFGFIFLFMMLRGSGVRQEHFKTQLLHELAPYYREHAWGSAQKVRYQSPHRCFRVEGVTDGEDGGGQKGPQVPQQQDAQGSFKNSHELPAQSFVLKCACPLTCLLI